MKQLKTVTVPGEPFEHGKRIGQQLKSRIHAFLDEDLKQSHPDGASWSAIEQRALCYTSYLSDRYPDCYQDVQGLAEGAEISLGIATYLQYRRELIQQTDSAAIAECSLFATLQTDRDIVLGQTIDLPGFFTDYGLLLHTLEFAGQPASLQYVFPGMLGYAGINSVGLGVGINMVQSSDWGPGLSPYLLIRQLLRCDSAERAKDLVVQTRVSSSRTLTFGDERALFCAELHPEAAHIEQTRMVLHTNHYLYEEMSRLDTSNIMARKQSKARLQRLAACVEGADVSVQLDASRVLADHENYPNSICYHSEGKSHRMDTVAAICMYPARGEIWAVRGHPCLSELERHSLR